MTQDLFADFQVVEGQTPIQTLPQPDASVLRPLFTIRFHPDRSSPRYCGMTVDAAALPVNLVVDVSLRSQGREYPAGNLYIPKGRSNRFGAVVRDLPPNWPAQVDVILRSSEAVARDTVDITQIWTGEIVLPNVPLPRPKTIRPATAPAAAPPSNTSQ